MFSLAKCLKFVYKFNKYQLPATFNNLSKLSTDVHSYNTKQTKIRNLHYQKHVQTQVLKY